MYRCVQYTFMYSILILYSLCIDVYSIHLCTVYLYYIFVYRCVLKMDHHCPWINTCVGHQNHTSFISFLFFLILGCIYAVLLNGKFLYHLFSYVSFIIII